ncbi:MAG TPA: hypothetical protein VMC84_10725 [Methanocella sp.]|nr:hypothetical protein [Methanocella sp.]
MIDVFPVSSIGWYNNLGQQIEEKFFLKAPVSRLRFVISAYHDIIIYFKG